MFYFQSVSHNRHRWLPDVKSCSGSICSGTPTGSESSGTPCGWNISTTSQQVLQFRSTAKWKTPIEGCRHPLALEVRSRRQVLQRFRAQIPGPLPQRYSRNKTGRQVFPSRIAKNGVIPDGIISCFSRVTEYSLFTHKKVANRVLITKSNTEAKLGLKKRTE